MMNSAPVQDGKLAYETRGDGEPVLLIHGALVADALLPLMDEPSLADYRLIRYHRRGYGDSSPAEVTPADFMEQAAIDAAALLDHLGIEDAHVVGHSSGAMIALELALEAPEVVRSLVLLEPPIFAVPSAAEFVEKVGPSLERYQAGDREAAVDEFMQVVGGPKWREAVEDRLPGSVEGAVRDSETFFEKELPAANHSRQDAKNLSAIPHPVLLLGGTETAPFFEECRGALLDWQANADGHVVDGLTHLLQLERPRPVAEGIAGFLEAQAR